MYLVFTRMSGGVTIGDSDHCYCVPYLLRAINSVVVVVVVDSEH